MFMKERTHDTAGERVPHPELIDIALIDDAARRFGRSGQALYEYLARLDTLREISDEIGQEALAERAARAELQTRVLLSAGLDALNELYDLGIADHSLRAAMKDPAPINNVGLPEAIRLCAEVLTKQFPDQQWGWLEGVSRLVADVNLYFEADGGSLRATLTQKEQTKVMLLSLDPGQRTDTRAFFSDGPDRVYISSSIALAPASETTDPVSAYDSAITGLAFAREWVYRHARNAAEIGAPAHTGGGPAAVLLVLVVIGALLITVSAIEFAICKKDKDSAACKWADILYTIGKALLGSGSNDPGSSSSNPGTNTSFQFGTNQQ